VLQPPLRRNCCGRCVRLPGPRLSPIRQWPMVVKQNPYDSANGHHVQNCGNAHLKDQVDQRLDSDDHQEREHGTEEKDGGDNRPFRPGRKVIHRWKIAGLLTGAQAREGAESCRWLRGARAWRSRRDGEGNVGIGGGVRFSGLAVLIRLSIHDWIYGPEPPRPADVEREADYERLVTAFPVAGEAIEQQIPHPHRF
jgi:hypothetical protein